jgi:allantoicase
MGEGWETARRRDGGNDWVELRLAGAGVVRLVAARPLDTLSALPRPLAAQLAG